MDQLRYEGVRILLGKGREETSNAILRYDVLQFQSRGCRIEAYLSQNPLRDISVDIDAIDVLRKIGIEADINSIADLLPKFKSLPREKVGKKEVAFTEIYFEKDAEGKFMVFDYSAQGDLFKKVSEYTGEDAELNKLKENIVAEKGKLPYVSGDNLAEALKLSLIIYGKRSEFAAPPTSPAGSQPNQ